VLLLLTGVTPTEKEISGFIYDHTWIFHLCWTYWGEQILKPSTNWTQFSTHIQIKLYFHSKAFSKNTQITWSVCSLNVWMHCLLLSSHTLTVWSELLETKCWLSGEKATLSTQEACPDRVPTAFACCLQQGTLNINKQWNSILLHTATLQIKLYCN